MNSLRTCNFVLFLVVVFVLLCGPFAIRQGQAQAWDDSSNKHTVFIKNGSNEAWIVDLAMRPYVPFGRPFYTDTDPKIPWPLPASALGGDPIIKYQPGTHEFSRWAKELAPGEIGEISCCGVPVGIKKSMMYIHVSAWLKSTGKMVWDVYFDEAAGDHILLTLEGNKAWFHCGNMHYWSVNIGR
jgi:hypothetical protein